MWKIKHKLIHKFYKIIYIIVFLPFIVNAEQDLQQFQDCKHVDAGKFSRALPGRYCINTNMCDMKIVNQIDRNHIRVRQNCGIGFESIGIVELTTSAGKTELPMITKFTESGSGEDVLDIVAAVRKSKDGIDYWSECTPKSPHQVKKSSKAKLTGSCEASISEETFKVIKKIDDSHYWLVNQSPNKPGESGLRGHMEMETHRQLQAGDTVQFGESTFLCIGSDFNTKWREGCSVSDKSKNDYTQGTWWITISPADPFGPPCAKAKTAQYNFAPDTLIKATKGGCVISDKERGALKNGFSILFLDCTNSDLKANVVYTRTRKECLQYVSMRNSFVNSQREKINSD
ncbi:MAG: hypothetical protein V4591_03330 [Bdellovibrionota bacterium]